MRTTLSSLFVLIQFLPNAEAQTSPTDQNVIKSLQTWKKSNIAPRRPWLVSGEFSEMKTILFNQSEWQFSVLLISRRLIWNRYPYQVSQQWKNFREYLHPSLHPVLGLGPVSWIFLQETETSWEWLDNLCLMGTEEMVINTNVPRLERQTLGNTKQQTALSLWCNIPSHQREESFHENCGLSGPGWRS